MKTVIIGGVAAGASAAARLRRLDEKAEIILIERGPYISYANCGLPYHVGNVIPSRESLLVITAEKFSKRFNIDVRTENEVTEIHPDAHSVTIQQKDGATYTETYEQLIICTGSSPIKVNLPGIEDSRIFQLWTLLDMDHILAKVKEGAKRAVVVGAGFIGLEVAENLRERGLDVDIIEFADQVLPTVDKEMSSYIALELANLGINVRVGRKVTAFELSDNACQVILDDTSRIDADLVIMSIGIRPNSELAQNAGITLGPRGHILVNEHMKTSNPDIYAAGDVVEVIDPILGGKTAIPLAGPANKQGRCVADNICGIPSVYRGTYGAAVVKVGNLAIASVGLTEKKIKQTDLVYEKIYTHPASNASYYPGGAQFHTKLIFGHDGKILGAQMVGPKGTDKRIDVVSVAMQNRMDVRGLADLELAYAPPFNSAKDPVNFGGMVAGNVLNKLSEIVHVDRIPEGAFLLDVRDVAENELGTLPNCINIPLETLRERMNELPKDKQIIIFCQVGLRGYIAERILRQAGYKVKNLSGGYLTWMAFHPVPITNQKQSKCSCEINVASTCSTTLPELDVRALSCPGPVVALKKQMESMRENESFQLRATISFEPDLKAWIQATGHILSSMSKTDTELRAVIKKSF